MTKVQGVLTNLITVEPTESISNSSLNYSKIDLLKYCNIVKKTDNDNAIQFIKWTLRLPKVNIFGKENRNLYISTMQIYKALSIEQVDKFIFMNNANIKIAPAQIRYLAKERLIKSLNSNSPYINPKTQLNIFSKIMAKIQFKLIYNYTKINNQFQSIVIIDLPFCKTEGYTGLVCNTKRESEQSAALIALTELSNYSNTEDEPSNFESN